MKKRYLSMLMAVVLCLTLGTGALAADGEVEAAAPVDVVEAVEAASVEEPAPEAEAEPVEEPAPLSASVPVPLDGANQPSSGVVIAGYGGTVVYNTSLPTPGDFSWNSPTPTGAQASVLSDDSGLAIVCDAQTEAGIYSFKQPCYDEAEIYEGTFSVLTLEEAIEQEKVSCEPYPVYTEYQVPGASPSPLLGVTVALYTSDPTTDLTAKPVATFTSGDHGRVELSAKNIPESALPKGVGADYAKTYYIKEIAVPDGYALSEGMTEFSYKAEWEKDSSNPNATTSLKFVRHNMEWRSGTLTSNRLTYDYAGFDLVAWTKENVTWSETEGYDWTEVTLPDVEFTVYADEACETAIQTFTTDENGKATITAADFGAEYRPAVDKPKTFYLKQTGAQSTEYGARPMSDRCWTLTASASQVDAVVTITLSLPNELLPEELAEDGTLWVYNERYTSLCFDLVKQVVKADETMPLGENRFDFAIVPCTFGDSALAYPELVFTPEGGDPVTQSDYTTAQIGGNAERAYKVSLTVDGAGTAKGTVTMQGWESAMQSLEVYEIGEAPADWEYADYMYILQPGETKLAVQFCPEDENGTHTGYAGKKYELQSGEMRDAVEFTNTYTKVAPAPTATPAPTAKPAQSPKTGDEANLALWLGLALSAALTLGYVSTKKKEN